MSTLRSRIRAIIFAGLLVSAPATVIAVILLTHPSPPASAAVEPAPAVTRQQVIDAAKKSTSIAVRIDRIEAKLTTFAALQVARKADAEFLAGFRPDRQLWLVVVSGDFVPQLARGERGTWGVFVTDANTGVVIGILSGNDGPWPSFFPAMVDLGP